MSLMNKLSLDKAFLFAQKCQQKLESERDKFYSILNRKNVSSKEIEQARILLNESYNSYIEAIRQYKSIFYEGDNRKL